MRGLFFGIGLHHKRSHFIRAVLEGILFSVYSIYIALRDLAGEAREIVLLVALPVPSYGSK